MSPKRNLISAAELMSKLATSKNSTTALLKIFDCRHRLNDAGEGRKLYLQGHIPGAVHLHLDTDLSAPVGFADDGHHLGRHPLPSEREMLERFGHWGIQPEIEVVVYDDMGGAMAARLWWMLRAVGHSQVRVLDGGWKAWEGRKSQTDEPLLVSNHVYPGKLDRNLICDFAAIKKPERDFLLLDARSPDRYRGENEPLDPPGGHIPGAINLPFANQLNADGTFKGSDELKIVFESVLLHRPIVCSCGSGVTACHLILGLALIGREDQVQLFSESFSGWSRTPGQTILR